MFSASTGLMRMYRHISLSKIQYRLPVVLLMALLVVHVASGESDKQSEDMKEICSNVTACLQWKTTVEALEVKAQKDQQTFEEEKSELLAALQAEKERVSFLEKQLQELRNKMKEDTKEIGRQKRQAEECLTDQYWDGGQCKWCSCPAGQQLRADYCGHGYLVGEPGCQVCPPSTYRDGGDNNQTCHHCSTCDDPDAFVQSLCTNYTDTVCGCLDGFVMLKNHCVSCRDHPDEKGCPITTPNPETSPEPSPELHENVTHTSDETPGNRCIIEWKVGLISIACSGISFILGMLAGIPIYISRIQSRGNQGTSGEGGEGGVDLQLEQRNGHAVDAQETPRDDQDPQHSPTENRVSTANGEANGLLAANNGVHVPVQ